MLETFPDSYMQEVPKIPNRMEVQAVVSSRRNLRTEPQWSSPKGDTSATQEGHEGISGNGCGIPAKGVIPVES